MIKSKASNLYPAALFALLFVFYVPFIFVACSQSPSARVVQFQTLKAVGQTAEAAVATTAQLYGSRQITAAQARQVMDLYDIRFQPTYRLAVSAVSANLDSFASPELAGLAAQLANLVLSFQNKTPTP